MIINGKNHIMRCILLLLVCLCVMGNILSHNTCTQKVNGEISGLSKRHPEIYEQLLSKKLPVKGIHWECLDSIQFSKANDTFFLAQKQDCQGFTGITTWNGCLKKSYSNSENGELNRESLPIFTKYAIKLISEWDTTEIRKEEQTNKCTLPSFSVYVYRIIFINKKCSVDYLYFEDFFNSQRDRNDFIEDFY